LLEPACRYCRAVRKRFQFCPDDFLGSGLIRKALREWLDKKTLGSPGGPTLILEWRGIPETPPFESYRGELLEPGEDAFS